MAVAASVAVDAFAVVDDEILRKSLMMILFLVPVYFEAVVAFVFDDVVDDDDEVVDDDFRWRQRTDHCNYYAKMLTVDDIAVAADLFSRHVWVSVSVQNQETLQG